jgi:hypothetical protein
VEGRRTDVRAVEVGHEVEEGEDGDEAPVDWWGLSLVVAMVGHGTYLSKDLRSLGVGEVAHEGGFFLGKAGGVVPCVLVLFDHDLLLVVETWGRG